MLTKNDLYFASTFKLLGSENIWAHRHIKITDFGLSKENVTDDNVKSFCGTPEYLAPEVLKRQKYGKAVDWWSLGTLLYEMISGLPPFYDRNRERMYKKVSAPPLCTRRPLAAALLSQSLRSRVFPGRRSSAMS